jgi:hypothetical protein
MQRIPMVVALFMAMLWLPATQHCGLEAAGILAAHCEQAEGAGGCGPDQHCAGDGCETVEGGGYKLSGGTPKLSAPLLAVCVCLVFLDVAEPALESTVDVFFRSYGERPLDWVPSWQFVRRAASPPRAPSVV